MSRLKETVKRILHHSLEVQPNDNIVIESMGECGPMIKELRLQLEKLKCGIHHFEFTPQNANNVIKDKSDVDSIFQRDMLRVRNSNVYIMVKSLTGNETLTMDNELKSYYEQEYIRKIHAYVLDEMKWISVRYPNVEMAQKAKMTLNNFDNYYFDAMTLDYTTLLKAARSLKNMLLNTECIHIVSTDTNISFSIKSMPVQISLGKINLPDGEVYTAPVKESVNGYIKYNVPSTYKGVLHNWVKLVVKDGYIVSYESDQQEALDSVFDTDKGVRYFGEFAIGINIKLRQPINDILFDEKIAASFHLTPGFSYSNASNGNESAVHWDLIKLLSPSYGGGTIYLDDMLLIKDGQFIPHDLLSLNQN